MTCNLCPRMCGAERTEYSGSGFCGVGTRPVAARAALHFDEEPPISGKQGSGAIFFSGCTLRCCYCQNFDLSRGRLGRPVTDLRATMEGLIGQGAANINLVTGTQFVPAILEALNDPLPVPVVWNSSGYERVETLRALEGRVQIYLPDLKYVDEKGAALYSEAPDYPRAAKKALEEMARQAGEPVYDDKGLMKKGMIVRHLVLPNRAAQSILALYWIRDHLPPTVLVSLMAQYVPCGDAHLHPEIDRPLLRREYDRVLDKMAALGLDRGFAQEMSASDTRFIPAFDGTGVQ